MPTPFQAAPRLREKLLYEVTAAHNATTQRERRAHFASAAAYGDALQILRTSDDAAFADGVAKEIPGSISRRELDQAEAFLGGAWKELGFPQLVGGPE